MRDDTSCVSLDDVHVTLGKVSVLDGMNLVVRRGEFVSLLGPSGAGKSTILNVIAGFLIPDRGRVEIEGRDVTWEPAHRRNLGFIFQDHALFPHLSVGRNVRFPLDMRRVRRRDANLRVRSALSTVGLAGFEDRSPRTLSGGQKQRVAVARALVFEPALLLMDEPLSSLDRSLREELGTELRRIQQEANVTVVYVTHDQTEALTLSDRVGVLGAGNVLQLGTPAEVHDRPRSSYVASVLGSMNLATVDVAGPGTAAGAVAVRFRESTILEAHPTGGRAAVGGQGVIGVRPYTITVWPDTSARPPTPGQNQLYGRFLAAELTGSGVQFRVDVGDGPPWLIMSTDRGHGLEVGGTVQLDWPISATVVMPE